MSLRRFVPTVVANGSAFAAAGRFGVVINTSSESGQYCRDTAAAFSSKKPSDPFSSDVKVGTTKHGKGDKGQKPTSGSTPNDDVGYDHARQPAANFWFDMTTEKGSGMNIMGGKKGSEKTGVSTAGKGAGIGTNANQKDAEFHEDVASDDGMRVPASAGVGGGPYTVASSPAHASQTNSKRLCHTRSSFAGFKKNTVAYQMARVLPLSELPQTSTGYFMM